MWRDLRSSFRRMDDDEMMNFRRKNSMRDFILISYFVKRLSVDRVKIFRSFMAKRLWSMKLDETTWNSMEIHAFIYHSIDIWISVWNDRVDRVDRADRAYLSGRSMRSNKTKTTWKQWLCDGSEADDEIYLAICVITSVNKSPRKTVWRRRRHRRSKTNFVSNINRAHCMWWHCSALPERSFVGQKNRR